MIERKFTLTACAPNNITSHLWKLLPAVLLTTVLITSAWPGFAAENNVANAGTEFDVDGDVDVDVDYTEAHMIVKTLHEKLLYIMQNSEELGYQGRYSEIQETVISSFDAGLIAKVIMSRYWNKLNEAQQTEFINLFKRLSVATYASRFDGYDGESFVELSTEMLKKGRLLIKTELQRPDDKPVKLDYLMHQKDGQWLIISVIANGVNDLSLKRAEYATVIKDREFQGLVEDVDNKIIEMENKEAK